MKKILSSILFLFSFQTAASQVAVNPRPRMEAMGGAGIAARGDADSAMINPAGLSDIRKTNIAIFPLTIEVPFDLDTLDHSLDYKDALDAADKLPEGERQAAKRTALENYLNKVSTTAAMTRINFYPSYTMPYFHVGFLVDLLVDAKLRAGGATSNQVANLGDSAGTAGLILAGSYSFLENRLHVGVTLKPLYRFSIMKNQEQTLRAVLVGKNPKAGGGDVGVKEAIIGENYTDNKAFGFGADLGIRYDLPFLTDFKPSVGLTYQDIADTRFFTDRSQPKNIPQSLSIGAAIEPVFGIFKNTFALDLRNITTEQEILNMVHLGAESVIWNTFILRAGVGQGYLSGGAGIDLKFFQFDAYVASKEVGERARIQDQTVVGVRIFAGL